ncbi:MAG: serine/threonine-protein kinase [Acidimicrobiales bacterium]
MPEETTQPRVVADRYLLRSVRGQGGMGTVWEAEDQLLERRVAVKEVHLRDREALGDEETLRHRVLREARVAARVSHPSLVSIYDVIDGGDRVFLVQEFVDAPTLHDVIAADGPLDPVAAARVGQQVLGALVALHAAGVVHRDVKPSNVLVLPDGGVKVADFGIALMEGDADLTLAGSVLGSPGYLAPEQAAGRKAEAAADLWALGATLWFAVEGHGPYGDTPGLAAIGEVVHGPVPAAADAGALAPVLEACMQKDPAERAGSAKVGRLLDDAAADRPPGAAGTTVAATMVAAPIAAPTEQMTLAPLPPPQPAPASTPAAERRFPGARSGTTPWLLGLAALVALIVLLAAGLALLGGDDAGSATSAGGTTSTSSPGTTAAVAPAAWPRHSDSEAGYSIAYPPGWQVRRLDGTRTDITDPATGTYMRIDWSKDPKDPLEAWQTASKAFASSHGGYEQLRLEETEFKGHPGAIWEYRYNADGGRLHASNLTFVPSEDRAYALNFQTADDRWDPSQGLRRQLEDSFQTTAPGTTAPGTTAPGTTAPRPTAGGSNGGKGNGGGKKD